MERINDKSQLPKVKILKTDQKLFLENNFDYVREKI